MNRPKLEFQNSTSSTAPMLPKETDEKVVIITPSKGGVGKILIREDTILANLQGCAGCGKAKFTCGGVGKQWSALCWGKPSDRKYYCLITFLSFIFVLSLIGSIFFCFTNTINDAILSSMVIRNNSLAYSIWRRPNVQPLMKVHVFNYTNWARVQEGLDDKLHVHDVGPYVYAQQVERVNVQFNGDRVTYQERNTFRYLPDKTVGASFDKVVVPNLPLLGVISKSVDMNFIVQAGINSIIRSLANHPNAFVELPVHSFLWGYDDNIIDVAKPYLSMLGQLHFDKFGLLVTKNGTVSDHLTINTGEHDKDKMNMIEKLNGADQLSFWSTSECNSISASDGSIFPPSMLDRKQELKVFFPNLCRRLPYRYHQDVEIADGIKLLRYQMPEDVFDDPTSNPANQCYCEIATATCPPRGVINVTACSMGAPALVSLPHFYRGEPRLREEVLGLNPDPAVHDNFLDIHPTLGIALRGKNSLQLNIQVKKTPSAYSLSYLKEGTILPIAWIEVSVEELPESLRSLVYHGTFSTAAAQLGLMVTSVISVVVSGACLCLLLVRKRRKPCATLKKFPGENELKLVQA